MPTTATDPVLRPIHSFDGARDHPVPTRRLDAIRERARAFREEALAVAPVRFYRSMELVRAPYPTRYAFLNAARVRSPMVHIANRLFVVQFDSAEGTKTLLASPTDHEAAERTPFFARLKRSFGPLAGPMARVLSPVAATVESCLERLGLAPEAVDYITYDHLHTQDLRRWLGTAGSPGYLPRAKLLVMRQEWESAQGLLPPQADWYHPEGVRGIDPSRVILLDGDVALGEGVWLVRTPGHTEGNHSIVCRTPEGVMVTSENGVGADSYAPLESRIRGVARHARETGSEVILNGNTLERGLDQYLSMVQEKEMAGPSARDPRFPNVVCSSELAAYWLFPGIRPTFAFGDLVFGEPVR